MIIAFSPDRIPPSPMDKRNARQKIGDDGRLTTEESPVSAMPASGDFVAVNSAIPDKTHQTGEIVLPLCCTPIRPSALFEFAIADRANQVRDWISTSNLLVFALDSLPIAVEKNVDSFHLLLERRTLIFLERESWNGF
jgi:hypothetical protein